MYKLIKNDIIVEDVVAESYGIEYVEGSKVLARVEDISTEKEKVEKLANLCNDKNLDPNHLIDIAEDAVHEFTSK